MSVAGSKRGFAKSRERNRLKPWDGATWGQVHDFSLLCECGARLVIEVVADRESRADIPKQVLYCRPCSSVVPWGDAARTVRAIAGQLQALAVRLVPLKELLGGEQQEPVQNLSPLVVGEPVAPEPSPGP